MTQRMLMLVALRAQVDALIGLEESAVGPDPQTCPCGASGETQVDVSSMHQRRMKCTSCGLERDV